MVSFPCRVESQTHQQRWVRAGDSFCTARGRRIPGSCGALPHDTFQSSIVLRVPHRAAEGSLLGTSLWIEKRGPCTNSSAGRTMIFSRRMLKKDFHCIVPAPVVIARRGRMVRLRSGRLDWTVQVGVPASACGWRSATSSPGESFEDMTMEFFQNMLPKQGSEARRSWDWTSTPDCG